MKNMLSKCYIIAFCLLVNLALYAVPGGPGSNDDSGTMENPDTPAAPIGDYLWILTVLGILFVFTYLKSVKAVKK